MDLHPRKHNMAEDIPGANTNIAEGSGPEALKKLQEFEKLHKLDPNLPLEDLVAVEATLDSGDAEKAAQVEADLVEENSPYPEVSCYSIQGVLVWT